MEALLEELQKEKAESKEASKRAADAAATAASSIQQLETNLASREADIKAHLENIERWEWVQRVFRALLLVVFVCMQFVLVLSTCQKQSVAHQLMTTSHANPCDS